MTPQHPPIRTAQIVHGALILGVLTATAMFVFLRLQSPREAQPEVTYALMTVIASIFLAYFLMRSVVSKRLLEQMAETRDESLELVLEGRIPSPLFTVSLITGAMLEGPGLMGAILVFLGGPWFALAAPLLAVCLIAMQMPTRTKLEEQVRGLTG